MRTIHDIYIDQDSIILDGESIFVDNHGEKMLKDIYSRFIGGYGKFYKMDLLSKLGFVASELLLQKEGGRIFDDKGCVVAEQARTDRAVVFFNFSGSRVNDMQYHETIVNVDDYFPSPATFVYTLPNIVTGEICIRNRYMGESNFMILPSEDLKVIDSVVEATFQDEAVSSILTGWIEASSCDRFISKISIIEK